MKNFFLLLIICFVFPLYGQQKNSIFYVTAKSGLILRKEANRNSSKITIIPYRSKIKIIDTVLNHEKIDGIEGWWYKIKYEEYEGHIFSGYIDFIDPEFRLQSKNKKCSYKNSIVECPDNFITMQVTPFKNTIDVEIPCFFDKNDFNLRWNVRDIRVSKSGKWLVITNGTDIYGALYVYSLFEKKLLYNLTYLSINFFSDESFEYTHVLNDKCTYVIERFENGKFKEIKRYKDQCMPY